MILAGCSPAEDKPTPPSPSESVVEQVPDIDHKWVQDLWVYESVSMIDASGTTIDLTESILSELATRQGEKHDLPRGASFTIHPDLNAFVSDADDRVREDVDVVAGILSAEGARGLAVLGSPALDAATPIGLADSVQFDLTFLDELAPGDPLLVDLAFLQTVAGPAPANLRGIELLTHRMEQGQTRHYGNADGVGVYRAHLGEAVAGSIFGKTPAKSGPMMDGFEGAVKKCRGGIKCVSDYFDTFRSGAEDSLILIDCNLGNIECTRKPDPDTPPLVCTKGSDCGEIKGDPHVADLAGNRFGMQAVGEFIGVLGDDLEFQIRTAPRGSSRTVSVLTKLAVRVDDTTIIFDHHEGAVRATVDSQEVDLGKAGSRRDVDGAQLETFRRAVQLTTNSGDVLTVTAAFGGFLSLWYSMDAASDFTGLLAGHENVSRSVAAADGTVIPLDETDDDFYDVFVDSWRVTDTNTLFTYDAGESTADHTDLAFPEEVLTKGTLTEEERARGLAVCTQAGIVSEHILAECVFDFTVTGSLDFVRDARYSDFLDGVATGRIQPNGAGRNGASSAGATFREASLSPSAEHVDDAGHALVQLRYEDRDQLHAIGLQDAEVDWSADMTISGCGIAVADGNRIVAPLQDGDGFAFRILDAQSGEVTHEVDASFNYHQCADMATAGSVAIAYSPANETALMGLDTDAGKILYEHAVPDVVAGPFSSTDGNVWVISSVDDELTAHEVDPATGELGKSVPLPGHSIKSKQAVAPTSDGFVVSVQGDGSNALVKVAPGGTTWETTFPIEIDGRDMAVPGVISADEETVAGYSNSDQVVVLDIETGHPKGTIKPSSFNNNGGQLTHHHGDIIVGPFSGNAWVEAYDGQSLELVWDRETPTSTKVTDAKRFTSVGDHGVMVLAPLDERDDDGVHVQFFDP